jgi:hypothetical protein
LGKLVHHPTGHSHSAHDSTVARRTKKPQQPSPGCG